MLVDGALTATAASSELCSTLARAGPFGAGNPEPILALPSHTVAHAEVVGQVHIRARLRSGDGKSINAISFRSVGTKLGDALLNARGASVHAAGTLSVDRWQGTERVQFKVIDIAPTDPLAQV